MQVRSSELVKLPIATGYILTMGNMQQSFDGILWLTLLTTSLLHRAYETRLVSRHSMVAELCGWQMINGKRMKVLRFWQNVEMWWGLKWSLYSTQNVGAVLIWLIHTLIRSPGYLTAGLFTEGNVININGSFRTCSLDYYLKRKQIHATMEGSVRANSKRRCRCMDHRKLAIKWRVTLIHCRLNKSTQKQININRATKLRKQEISVITGIIIIITIITWSLYE